VTGIELKEIDFSFQTQMAAMIDFSVSWQNNFQALLKAPEDFTVIGAFCGNDLVGFGIIEPHSGDIPQLAVSKGERRKGVGRALIYELKKRNKADIVKIVNVESTESGTIAFIHSCGIPKIVSQYEMIKKL
jgi:GNAT superfamily N-acetyltransferase